MKYEGIVITLHAPKLVGTMVSANITDSTGPRETSPCEEGAFFLMLLLQAARDTNSTTKVGNYETEPFLEETSLLNQPPLFQSFSDIAFAQ
ncbi:MAG TPA: hypothetical protein VGS11_05585 [Candidatus Bathyarchaeia archaeon]|nr:hypothetical protein [Candidatus Bathyarchaeia archaeon]